VLESMREELLNTLEDSERMEVLGMMNDIDQDVASMVSSTLGSMLGAIDIPDPEGLVAQAIVTAFVIGRVLEQQLRVNGADA